MNKVVIKEKFDNYVIAETYAGLNDISAMRRSKRVRLMRRAERLLKEEGAEATVICDSADEVLKMNTQRSCRIPKPRIFECFKFALQKCDDKIENLVIVDKDLSAVTFEMLGELCRRVRYITLCTEQIKPAQRIAERLLDEYGACVFVESKTCCRKKAVINIDEAYVRIGDFVINGAEFECKIGEYCIDGAVIAALLGEDNGLEIKNWLSGKNIIKIS